MHAGIRPGSARFAIWVECLNLPARYAASPTKVHQIIGVYGFQQAWETPAFAPHAMLQMLHWYRKHCPSTGRSTGPFRHFTVRMRTPHSIFGAETAHLLPAVSRHVSEPEAPYCHPKRPN